MPERLRWKRDDDLSRLLRLQEEALRRLFAAQRRAKLAAENALKEMEGEHAK